MIFTRISEANFDSLVVNPVIFKTDDIVENECIIYHSKNDKYFSVSKLVFQLVLLIEHKHTFNTIIVKLMEITNNKLDVDQLKAEILKSIDYLLSKNILEFNT